MLSLSSLLSLLLHFICQLGKINTIDNISLKPVERILKTIESCYRLWADYSDLLAF